MLLILFFILGASIGSFIGLVVDRFPNETIIMSRSHCNHCNHVLSSRDLIPILSQSMTKSRCRYCKETIPFRYIVLELSLGPVFLLFALGWLSNQELLFITFSIPLTLYDVKNQEFPLLIWLIPNIAFLIFFKLNHLALILVLIGFLAERYDLKIGSGDFLYLATLALLTNWQSLFWVIELGSLFGILACLIYRRRQLPFLPFLFLGYCLTLFFNCT